ncbi:hypothetical protein RND81_02G179400 [Saponaria officinalis]|uniref:PORR domain-containing protein n=1 Tax=Saponaria officinalis TaxID=3572 RepID=A0AAW1MR60_SAPOF
MFTVYNIHKHFNHHHFHHNHHRRTFIAARIKWVRDPYIDTVVSREKNLLPCLTLKSILLSYPPSSPPSLSAVSLHKPLLNLPSSTSTLSFFRKYPSLFSISPKHSIPQITPQFLALYNEEQSLHSSPSLRRAMAVRLCKFLMLTKACKIPLCIIDDFRFDLGLPLNYLLNFVPYYPEYFRVCTLEYDGKVLAGLELVKWRGEFATPAILRDGLDFRRGRLVKFPMSFAPGFDLQKRVLDWVEKWQCLPYISPYEDAFHLAPRSDQAEKYTVSVLHEILSVLISKKTEMNNLLRLGDYLGFGMRFKKAFVHYPGIFYFSNKIRTQTVVLREAFRKDVLLEKNPLMGMRHRYIYLMSKSRKGRKYVRKLSPMNRVEVIAPNEGSRSVVGEDGGHEHTNGGQLSIC